MNMRGGKIKSTRRNENEKNFKERSKNVNMFKIYV